MSIEWEISVLWIVICATFLSLNFVRVTESIIFMGFGVGGTHGPCNLTRAPLGGGADSAPPLSNIRDNLRDT